MKKEDDTKRLPLDYPCTWLYKVIGSDRQKLQQAILDTAGKNYCIISPSNSSRTGKYHCFNLEVTVRSEDERNAIYLALKKHPHVRIVL